MQLGARVESNTVRSFASRSSSIYLDRASSYTHTHTSMDKPPTQPTLTTHTLTSSDLALPHNAHLVRSCSDLVNRSFREMKRETPQDWDYDQARIPAGQTVLDALGPKAICAVTYTAGGDAHGQGSVPVAFAAAVPWLDHDSEIGPDDSEGDLEIKLVCLDPDPSYAKRGIAGKTWRAVVDAVVATHTSTSASTRSTTLRLWLLSAQALTGEYWLKQGWTLTRTKTVPRGTWGSLKDFDMLTFSLVIEM